MCPNCQCESACVYEVRPVFPPLSALLLALASSAAQKLCTGGGTGRGTVVLVAAANLQGNAVVARSQHQTAVSPVARPVAPNRTIRGGAQFWALWFGQRRSSHTPPNTASRRSWPRRYRVGEEGWIWSRAGRGSSHPAPGLCRGRRRGAQSAHHCCQGGPHLAGRCDPPRLLAALRLGTQPRGGLPHASRRDATRVGELGRP